MSDGITDSYRDQRRGERYEEFLKVLAGYIENQTLDNLEKLKSAAASVDDVPRGLMSGKTDLSSGLEAMLAGLVINDPKVWGKLLLSAMGVYPNKTYLKLKRLSPFADGVLIGVNSGQSFVNLVDEELQEFLDYLIQGRENLKIYDCDKYLVVLPPSVKKRAKVTWLNCGIYNIKEPRKAREKKSK